MDKISAQDIIDTLYNCDIRSAINNFVIEQNDDLTNEVRKQLDKMDNKKIKEIQTFLNHLLNLCYDSKLFPDEPKEDDNLIKNLNNHELFLFKETIIYFLGRLSIIPNIDVLKKAYNLDNDKYIKLNLTFSSLCTFDEDIEKDFVSKILPGNEYDNIIRSWTMAFFTKADDPYNYIDHMEDDWKDAKISRIKRLSINNEDNPNFLKAMSFRLLDLLVIYLFLESRKNNILTDQEKEIIKNAYIEYSKYSPQKQQTLKDLKLKILKR